MLKDSYGRMINYLRISIIDRCNLRCSYCMPPTGIDLFEHDKIIRYEELILIIEAAAQLGVKSIRLTGGEPLIRKGLLPFIKVISAINGIEDIAITTNGILLGEMSQDLKKVGVTRVNISLDTLNQEKYKIITGSDSLKKVLASIDRALEIGFEPVKINVVLLKDNFNEVVDFVKLTQNRPLHIRFIEMMPLGEYSGHFKQNHIPWADALKLITNKYSVEQSLGPKGQGPAKYYSTANAKGTFGFINAVSNHFCGQCNRLRITSDGYLKTCLFEDSEINLKKLSQKGDIDKIKDAFISAVQSKPKRHEIKKNTTTSRYMSQIGG